MADGGEVDLDLGNYERFLDVTLTRENNITTGKIYSAVIEKEVLILLASIFLIIWQRGWDVFTEAKESSAGVISSGRPCRWFHT